MGCMVVDVRVVVGEEEVAEGKGRRRRGARGGVGTVESALPPSH